MEKVVFQKSNMLTDAPLHFCPGCSHGIANRLIAECMEELNIDKKNIVGIAPVGCAVFNYNYFDVDMIEAAHGRAPAVATGLKRVLGNDKFVFVYQGDGDLASIGAAEIIHAAARCENISVVFINNGIYGMTGGQMAPTSLLGQKSTTSQKGRDIGRNGYPVKMSEMLAQLDGATYIERVSTHDAANVRKAKQAIKTAFKCQLENKGFSMIEVLSACPTNWGLTPVKAMEHIKNDVIPYYPLGVFADRRNEK
ncbi:MAG: thiamine pyrophosphate-dependent enzyme [Clostridia bacterium]|nr:thiamine pyrophosphate-dependent enzyme [Clostridia bacterium]